MKQEIKNKLVICSKIAIVIGSILLWLVSFIGISAYSVYWLRQNAAYEVENTQHEVKPKQLNSNNDYVVVHPKTKEFLSTPLLSQSSGSGTNNYRNYFSFSAPQGSNYIAYYELTFEGDFYCRRDDINEVYTRINFRFDYQGTQDEPTYDLTLNYIILVSSTGLTRTIYSFQYDVYNDWVLYFSSISNVYLPSQFTEVYRSSIFDFYFEKILDTTDSYKYSFVSGSRNLPQYLKSYTRLQYGQIMYSSTDVDTDTLTIPMVFFCNGRLYDNITILLRPCWYYYNSAGQIVDNWAITPTGTNIPYVCAYVLFGYYGKTLDWTYDDNYAGVLSSVSNGSMAMYLGYNGYTYQDDTNPSFWAPNYLVVAGLQVVTDYQDIYVKDVDSVPFVNSLGNNLKPYNNITIRNILESYFNFYGDVSGYNGAYYDVGLGNVFTLLSDAFQSLIPLMAIQIIPGITLGLLVLLPLVVTIILVIIKLVKK